MGKSAKILIVDDNADTVDLLRKRLRSEGYETDEAHDGETALAKVRDFWPDLVLLDVMMPKRDGFEVCRLLKEDEETKQISVLMLTARSEVGDKVQGLDFGADGYITKPFDYKEVAARIRSILAQREENRRLAEREKHDALDHLVDEVSHEVRNPLTTIGGLARRVRNNLPEDDRNRKYLDIILQNVEVLEKMVHQLIALKGATFSYFEATEGNSLIRAVLDRLAPALQAHSVELVTQFMATPPQLPADRENLETALGNIVENALEAMDQERRRLTVSTSVEDGFFEIRVADTGRGIAREKLKNIFDPFFTSKTYGPGLGLTFALKTVQSHKGMIAVESREQEGTTFIIRLPVKGRVPDVKS